MPPEKFKKGIVDELMRPRRYKIPSDAGANITIGDVNVIERFGFRFNHT